MILRTVAVPPPPPASQPITMLVPAPLLTPWRASVRPEKSPDGSQSAVSISVPPRLIVQSTRRALPLRDRTLALTT